MSLLLLFQLNLGAPADTGECGAFSSAFSSAFDICTEAAPEVVQGGGWTAGRIPNVIQSQGTAIRLRVAVATRPGRIVPAFERTPVTVESFGTTARLRVWVAVTAGVVEPADDPDELRILGLLE